MNVCLQPFCLDKFINPVEYHYFLFVILDGYCFSDGETQEEN